MTIGYSYHPLIKITPTDGAAKTLDLREEFRDAKGQTRTRVDYELEADDYTDVNYRERLTKHGIRVNVRMRFAILQQADHASLAEIVTALAQTGTVVELSLDAGSTFREVVVVDLPSPRALAGKTYIGAEHEIRLRCVELLTEMPAMTAEGAW